MATDFILIKGNPVDGFEFVGPFPSNEDAMEHGDSVKTDWWVAELEEPAK